MNRLLFTVLTLAAMTCSLAHAQDLSGDWQATVSAGDADQRLVLHVTKNADRTFKALLDSVDLGMNGLAVTNLDVEGANLTFDVDAIDASFKGRLQGDGNTIMGRWQQGRPSDLEFDRSTTPIKTEHKPAKRSDIDGKWIGALEFGTNKLHVVFVIVNTEDGLMATLGSPDQGSRMLPATLVIRDGSSLKIEAKGIGGVYRERLPRIAPRLTAPGTREIKRCPCYLNR